MTLEEAQAKVLELTETVQTLTAEKETLSQDNETLKADNENLRTLNQKYFNKLIAQETPENHDKEEPDEDTPTCEEFAKTLTI